MALMPPPDPSNPRQLTGGPSLTETQFTENTRHLDAEALGVRADPGSEELVAARARLAQLV